MIYKIHILKNAQKDLDLVSEKRPEKLLQML
jgi:mRNA-degrading endonuclease RelE of RelBE toxin-antitoxin system